MNRLLEKLGVNPQVRKPWLTQEEIMLEAVEDAVAAQIDDAWTEEEVGIALEDAERRVKDDVNQILCDKSLSDEEKLESIKEIVR